MNYKLKDYIDRLTKIYNKYGNLDVYNWDLQIEDCIPITNKPDIIYIPFNKEGQQVSYETAHYFHTKEKNKNYTYKLVVSIN